MPDMHDDTADQLMRQLRARMFTTSVHVDGVALPATPRRYFETAERLALVLDVQAVQGGGVDGRAVIHVGEHALTLSGAEALRNHLGELVVVISEWKAAD